MAFRIPFVAIVLACLLFSMNGVAQDPTRSGDSLPPTASEVGGEDLAAFDPSQALRSEPPPMGEEFSAGRIIAVVGTEPVLIGDLVPPATLEQFNIADRQFELELRKALVQSIARKCMAQHFIELQTSGKPKKERDDIRTKMVSKTTEIFRTQVLPEQIKQAKCESERDFIEKLESQGSSMPSLMRSFTETAWAEQAIKEAIKEKKDVPLIELKDYYDRHATDWDREARVRFRVLAAPFKEFGFDRQAAYQAIVDMGNQVFLGGANFEAVAKQFSKGYKASDGGLFGWTHRGDLKSKTMEDAIFTIQLNALSPILEDADGFYIVEVLEREEARTLSFAESQAEIRKTLLQQRKEQERKKYIQKVMENTPIWTRWPQDIPGSQDLANIVQ